MSIVASLNDNTFPASNEVDTVLLHIAATRFLANPYNEMGFSAVHSYVEAGVQYTNALRTLYSNFSQY